MAAVDQNSFNGGMNFLTTMTKLSEGEYPIASNVRVRYGGVDGVRAPKDFTSKFPSGNLQGIYGANEKLLVVISGSAYYIDCISDVVTKILGFSMAANVQDIFAELVPAIGTRYTRIPENEQANTSVKLTSPTNGTAAAGVFFDGISRPNLIFSDGSARAAQAYKDWTPDSPEYVPQGLIPLYVNGILYLAAYDNDSSPNRTLSVLTRSVTNDPLNFMVIVDKDGNKLPSESDGGAKVSATPFNFGSITSVARVSSPDGTFYVSTAKSSVLVQPDFTNIIYGEPTFNQSALFDTGAVNPFSVVDILGDTAIIDQNGLISFNAVQQLKFQGNNSPFSKSVYKLFQGITQKRTAAVNFDNYALFSITTIYGPAVLVYDTLIARYVSIDFYPNIEQICQFAIVKTSDIYRLFARTIDNQILELYAGDKYLTSRIYIGDHASGDTKVSQVVESVGAVFMGSEIEGTAECRVYIDKVECGYRTAALNAHNYPITKPYPFPYQYQKKDSIPATFRFDALPAGFKIGCQLSWNTGAQLVNVTLNSKETSNNLNTVDVEAITDTSASNKDTFRICVMSRWTEDPSSTPGAKHPAQILTEMRAHDYDYLISTGGMNPQGLFNTITTSILDPLTPEFFDYTKYFTCLSTCDFDVNNGRYLVDVLRQPNNGRYFASNLDGLTCGFINHGYTTAAAVLDGSGNPVGPTLEPDGNVVNSVQYNYFKSAFAAGTGLNILLSDLTLYSNYLPEYKLLRWDILRQVGVVFSYGPEYENIQNTLCRFVNLPGDFYAIIDIGTYQANVIIYRFAQAEPVDAFVIQK